jgi:hypothetical protein
MILVVSGTRRGRDDVREVLDKILIKEPVRYLLHGDASGVDSQARNWAMSKGIYPLAVPALWVHFGKRAGPQRNRRLLRVARDLAEEKEQIFFVAFPGSDYSPGTRDAIEAAKEAGLKSIHVYEESP